MSYSTFWSDAEVYDIATRAYMDDVVYWQRLVEERRPGKVLELACGTGRIALPLIETGVTARDDFQFAGVDRSPEFVAVAKQRLAERGEELARHASFIEGDMRSFSLNERFDLIIIAYNSFSFLFEIEDQLACLTAIREHLAPGGVFALDLHMPPLDLLVQAKADTFPALRQDLHLMRPAPSVSRVTSAFVTTSWDISTQTEQTTHFIEVFRDDGRHESHPFDITWHHVFPRELELMARLAGLKVVKRYGDYGRAPFCDASKQYLWLMQAA